MSRGYEDTPLLPGGKWTVHDGRRPQPPDRGSGNGLDTGARGRPPADASVLFDGKDLAQWDCQKDGPVKWKLENGYMEVGPKSGGLLSKAQCGDCQLHVEWAVPAVIEGTRQGRGNSGVFLMNRYEIQVLDCYQNPTDADGITAALYGQYPPLVNACRPPGDGQTYDVMFLAPRFGGDRLVRPAFMTVIHNRVVVQYHRERQDPTQHKRLACYQSQPPVGPLQLQDHNNPARFRTIWYRPRDYYEKV